MMIHIKFGRFEFKIDMFTMTMFMLLLMFVIIAGRMPM